MDQLSRPLEGRVAVVTGGSRGIGYGVAEQLCRRGASVILAARTEDDVLAAAHRLSNLGEARGVAADVTSPDAAQMLIDTAVDAYGHLDTLACCHGVYDEPAANFLKFGEDTFMRALSVNLVGAFRCASAAAKAMVSGGVEEGRMVFIASVDALAAEPNCVGYNTSKAATLGLMRSIAVDLAQYGITANAIAPGWVATPMTAPSLPDAVLEGRAPFELTPAGRIGQPRDIGHVAAWLCDPANRYMTGATVVADGGQTVALAMPSEYGASASGDS